MRTRPSKTLLVTFSCLLLAGALATSCSETSESGSGSGGASASSTGGSNAGECGGARVTIAFFSDASCSEESQAGQRVYDTSLECFSWTAQGSHAEENSATRFQCYRDRLCYTQHADTLTCSDGAIGPTDKQARNGECIKEPAGSLYSMLLGGNEGCPEAPEGFACPESAAQMGTDGIVACASAP